MSDIRSKLQRASSLLQSGDASACMALCNQLLEQQPGLLPATHMRGIAAARLGMPGQAISDLSQVWPKQTGNHQAALALGSLLRLAGRYEEAVVPLQAACADPGLEATARYELGRVLTRLRRSGEAMDEYRDVLRRQPQHADAAANLAFLLERANRLSESEQWVDRALDLAPANVMARLTKATLERRRGELALARRRLESLLADHTGMLNSSIALNQLGQCLEQEGCWAEAWASYSESNSQLRQNHEHGRAVPDGSYGLETVAHIHRWLKTSPPDSWSRGLGEETDSPVFMVGFPRSGTTLLDQALSAHPDIEVLEEFEFFDEVRREWVEGEGLARLAQLEAAEISSARNRYLDAVRARRSLPERPLVIDKLPLNLVYLFLIHRLFPGARIIFVLRDPRDACLSCYFQSFDLAGAMPYFLDLGDTVNYYDQVMRLAIDTRDAISNPVHEVRYESLVGTYEGTMRGLIDFLGLDWSAEVLEYRQRALNRTIHTPSYQQVVQPLYTRSIGRWRNFRTQAEPQLARLSQWVEYFAYDGE